MRGSTLQLVPPMERPEPRSARRPAPGFHHIVQFYEEDSFLIESVARFLAPAVETSGSCIVVATAPHRQALVEELEARGYDMASAIQQDRWIAADAEDTLNKFLVEGWPDPALFASAIGTLLKRTAGRGPVAIFGEMVALLWERRRREAALRLEKLWNQVAASSSFSLFCAYPLASFQGRQDREGFYGICGLHSEVNPAEEYPLEGGEKQRRRKPAHLPRALARESEIRRKQKHVMVLQSAAQAGTWELDLTEEAVFLSPRAARICGLPCGELPVAEFVKQMAYSGDRDSFAAALKRARTGRKEFVLECRIRRGAAPGVLSIRGRTFYNNNRPLIVGMISDITPDVQG